FRLGKLDSAESVFREVIELEPERAESIHLLGIICIKTGRQCEALEFLNHATILDPSNIDYLINYGMLLQMTGNVKLSIPVYERTLEIKEDTETINNLGNAYQDCGELKKALTCYEKVLEKFPNHYKSLNNAGNICKNIGKTDKSLEYLKRSIAIKPDYTIGINNLGNVYLADGKITKAIKTYEKVLEIDPDHAMALNNLGNCYVKNLEVKKGIEYYQKSLVNDKSDAQFRSNLLLGLHYEQSFSTNMIFEEHLKWNNIFKRDIKHSFENYRYIDRKLRIGYVSPDFRAHSVAYFFLPLLESHDRSKFEIYCFADFYYADWMSIKIQESTDHWINITGLTHEDAAKIIKSHEIDILIDLAGHTKGNRLGTFVLKPAPIQISWLGYPDTTGIDNIDYRFVDENTDPTGVSDKFSSEKLIRLVGGFHCYEPPPETPEVSELPVKKSGDITFGSFNNTSKVTEDVIQVWSQILKNLPDSQIILKSIQLADENVCKRYMEAFIKNGCSASQIKLISFCRNLKEHFQLYNSIDIGLDPFPYNGTTTTFEALWMGVPVLTLAGERHCGRVGISILKGLGMDEFVADDKEEYVSKAIGLSNNFEKLSSIRHGLRFRLMKSDFCNKKKFSMKFEKALLEIWGRWYNNN
ncbi:tetratricopeptide repeat protein, partial [bacterium]|nr:tetratricopeptide repeat protein [bacterium]